MHRDRSDAAGLERAARFYARLGFHARADLYRRWARLIYYVRTTTRD